MYWWYEMWVPLNSQRVQLRSVLLTQRVRLPESHPLAYMWPAGRFTGLLKDVDEVINGIWKSCLQMIDDLVTMVYIIILCFLNLAISIGSDDSPYGTSYGTYAAVFLDLGVVEMATPFLWFRLFKEKHQECENMVRDDQALYMSAASHILTMRSLDGPLPTEDGTLVEAGNGNNSGLHVADENESGEKVARKAFRLFGLTTFRIFFQLAWTTNYSLLAKVWEPLVAYGLLTGQDFRESFDTTSTLIVLLSLRDLTQLSSKLLFLLIVMSRGCNVLRDVAELLNADVEEEKDQGDSEGRDSEIEEGDIEKDCIVNL